MQGRHSGYCGNAHVCPCLNYMRDFRRCIGSAKNATVHTKQASMRDLKIYIEIAKKVVTDKGAEGEELT